MEEAIAASNLGMGMGMGMATATGTAPKAFRMSWVISVAKPRILSPYMFSETKIGLTLLYIWRKPSSR